MIFVWYEEFYNFCLSPSISRVMKWRRIRWIVHVVHMEEVRGACIIFVGKTLLGRPMHTCWDNI